MKTLYQHQVAIIDEDKPKTGLFLGCGGGKTLVALLMARGKTIVVAPKTQVEDKNWEREVMENDLTIDLTVISKETFRRDWKTLPACDTLILDEAHTMCGVMPATHYINKQEHIKTSQIFDAVRLYIEKHNPERVYLATATIAKSAMTVWGAGQLLGKTWDFDQFREVYYWRRQIVRAVRIRGKLQRRKVEIWSPRTDKATKERLANTVKKLGYTGRLQDWFDVPEQTHKNVKLDLHAKQVERIKQFVFEYPEPIVRVGKVHQVENGVLKADEFSPAEYFENTKSEWLKDHAVEFPQMIVFAKYTAQIEMYERELREEGYDVYTMTGATKDRGALLDELKVKDDYILIVQSQISSGWELPVCPVMVFASRTYSFVDYEQGLGRILRSKALKKNLYITLTTKGYTDEAVHQCVTNKVDFNEEIYANKLFK